MAARIGVGDAQGHVALQLLHQARPNLAAGQVFAFPAGKRAVVDAKGHAHRRLFDRNRWQRAGVRRIGQRVTDSHIGNAGDRHDVAGLNFVFFLSLQVAEAIDLADLARRSGRRQA